MTIDDKIRDEKLQYHINREAAKILTLSSGIIDKYKNHEGATYHTGATNLFDEIESSRTKLDNTKKNDIDFK